MKTRRIRACRIPMPFPFTGPAKPQAGQAMRPPRLHGSAWILASLGLLAAAAPWVVQAQGAGGTLPAGTLPVVRGVVAGSLIFNDPRLGQPALNSNPQANSRGGPTLSVSQQGNRAVVDWSSFNIAQDSQVVFYHPSTTAATLNRIYGSDPSVIQGQIRSRLWDPSTGSYNVAGSGGQVILINQNGILFDRGSQVNVGALIASTLNLRNDWYTSGLALSAAAAGFEGGYDAQGQWLARRPDGTRPGNIGIGSFGPAGAAPPLIEAAQGGSVMIFAPRIDNDAGVIRAPDGQVILAAGKKVFLSVNPNAGDITLRGLVVEVAAEDDGAGLNLSNLIRQAGDVSAERGNVSIAALAVNQQGRVSANTAVQANGSIFLKARSRNDNGSFKAGTVTLAAGSTTVVDPDRADTSTVPESQDYSTFRGVIDVRGGNIASSGTLRATGGRLTLLAEDATAPQAARVYLDAGSITSTAGAWADVSPDKNFATFRVTSNELKNSPDQKTGILRGATVTVDLRQGNNILDLTGYRGTVPRTVAEKAAAGGELVINATGSVIQRVGATLDVSGGGYLHAQASTAGSAGSPTRTSLLLGADGKVYDIATAPQALPYTAQLDRVEVFDARWGQTRVFVNPLGAAAPPQSAYAEGKAGGVLSIGSSAGVVLDGTLKGGVTIGAQQLGRAPAAGSLSLGIGYVGVSFNGNPLNTNERIGNLRFQQTAADSLDAAFTRNSALTTALQDNIALAATQIFGAAAQTAIGRVESGFGSVAINSNGTILVPDGVSIRADVGASLVLRSPRIEVDGDIRLPAGNLSIETVAAPRIDVPGSSLSTPERIFIGNTAQLSTTGAWLNNASRDGSAVGDSIASGRLKADGTVKRAIDGGNITLAIDDQNFQTRLARGAVLEAGGGGSINSSQRITGGVGGRLTIANGNTAQTTSDWMQADLSALAINSGGELTLNLQRALIEPNGANGTLPADTTRLEARSFLDQGFSRVTVNAAAAIEVTQDTPVVLRQKNLVLDAAQAAALPTGGDIGSVASVQLLPDPLRAPASLTLRGGSMRVAPGASITTDPRGQISLSGETALRVDGQLLAPAGNITLALRGPVDLTASDLHLSALASLSTRGVFVPVPDSRGLTMGTLFNGGTVTLSAEKAGVRVDRGAVIDVGGVNQQVDVVSGGPAPAFLKQTLQGHAGSLLIHTEGATTLAGTMRGHGGDGTAAGATFALESARPDRQATLPAERRIVVTASGRAPTAIPGVVDATVDVSALTEGGFEKLRLMSENRIEFQGSSRLAFERGIRLDAPRIDVAGNARVTLSGAGIALGQSQAPRVSVDDGIGGRVWLLGNQPAPVLPTVPGTGVLMVQAQAVDLFGNLTLNGTSLTRFESATDVRFIGRDAVTATNLPLGQTGWLHTSGNLEFKAAQLYPATRTSYEISVASQPSAASVAAGYLLVTGNGTTPGDVYSAGGTLKLQAETIVQNGTVKAPLGRLAFNASRLLELGTGSVTSVSGDGLNVLYGSTESGVTWSYRDNASNFAAVDAVLAGGKRIDLTSPELAVRNAATLDLRGGGDVVAVEFVPGNGGDSDATRQDNTFAVLPASRLGAMPYDTDLQFTKDLGFGFSISQGRDNALYDAIDIGAGSAVAAGRYVLLPARFALLPGAYLVQLQTGTSYRNLADGQTSALLNGNTVVAGHRSAMGTGVRESQSVGVVVLPGSALLQRSDFTLSGAALLAEAAERSRLPTPAAPWDAGRLGLAGASKLSLQGQFFTDPGVSKSLTPARVAQVDISGPTIAVVDRVGRTDVPADFLQLDAASLTRLNASVLLGGSRTDTPEGARISTVAREVRVLNDAATAVTLPELILTASSSVDVAPGSVLRATGSGSAATAGALALDANSALLRLSSGAQATPVRDAAVAGAVPANVSIGSGAVLSASRSLLVDATGATQSTGQLLAGGDGGQGGSLSLSSRLVNLGQTAAGAAVAAPLGGLVLSNADLARYARLDELVLRGYGSIDFLGSTQLGSGSTARLVLDTPALRALGTAATAATVDVTAGELSLVNTRGGAAALSSGGTATLNLRADTLLLGAGDKVINGFASVNLQAEGLLRVDAQGSLSARAALAVETPLLQVGSAAKQRFSALDGGTVSISRGSATASAVTAAALAAPALGGQLLVEGGRLEVSTALQAASGRISLQANGATASDGVTLARGASLDASGRTRDFNGSIVAAGGGNVALGASSGVVDVQAGATVNVSAANTGSGTALVGDAGRLSVRGAALLLAGDVVGQAAGADRSASVDIDVAALADFSALNSALNRGGFAHERQLRQRGGDVRITAGDNVQARSVSITADSGRIDVAGSVGRGAAEGGAQITLNAATGLSLAAGASVLAQGSAAAARGGEVRLSTRSGSLQFDSAATIDLRAGAAGPAGALVFAIGRDAAGRLGPTRLQGLVKRHGDAGDPVATVDVEATRVYGPAEVGSSIGNTQITRWAAEHQAFVTASAATASAVTGSLRDTTGALAGARLLGAVELHAAGNLSLDNNWDLTTAQWLAAGNPGTLSIRAAGTLSLRDTLGAPRLPSSTNANTHDANQNINHAIRAGDTWNIRLAAGADLNSADSLATRLQPVSAAPASAGDLLLIGANANIRTGTGRIDLAALRHVQMDNINSAVYTAGRIGATDLEAGGNNRWAEDGGSISMRAGGNVSGPRNAQDLWVTEWLRRPKLLPNSAGSTYGFSTRQPTDWWSYRPRFQQGVGTLAGGDIDIRAGGDVLEFSAVLPTSGRTFGTIAAGDRAVQVTGGGNLDIQAGGDVVGGTYLMGRGTGRVQAVGDIGGAQAVQLFMMGASSGRVPERATMELVAGGSVALKSVDNPTVLSMTAATAAFGPSFSLTSASVSTPNNFTASSFYTYAANSAVGLLSKGGEVSYTGRIDRDDANNTPAVWRGYTGAAVPGSIFASGTAIAFPASVAMVAMDGSVTGTNNSDNTVRTYPSAQSTVSVLASDSVVSAGFSVSARDPLSMITPFTNFATARTPLTNAAFDVLSLSGDSSILSRSTELPFGLVQRTPGTAPYRFDFQALGGSIGSPGLLLSGLSRLRAGTDVLLGYRLNLQNLGVDDVAEIRADTGDIRVPAGALPGSITMGGPGRLVLHAGRSIDLGKTPVQATANAASARVGAGPTTARLTFIAGVRGDVNLANMDTPAGGRTGAYDGLIALNKVAVEALNFFETLGQESDAAKVLAAGSITALARDNSTYQPFVSLDAQPRLLASYQSLLRRSALPLAPGADKSAALALYALLNAEADVNKLKSAGSLSALAALPGGEALSRFIALDQRYPRLFSDYVQRRGEGAVPRSLMPIVFSEALDLVVETVVPRAAVSGGSILSYQTSVQTQGGSDIDLWAPRGDIVVGLTTPGSSTIGVITATGGAVRAVLSGDYNVNQGKVITAQGGDILLFSSQGSIDAGRGAKTSAIAPAPIITRAADGTTTVTFSGAATGSGIQSTSSDPDGLGPRATPTPGNVYLFAPAGTIDAGEAGIRSGGNILINAQAVRNAADIRAGGSSQGVPQLQLGTLATALASGGGSANPAKAAEDSAKAAGDAARKAAAAPPPPRPTILSVEVLGFGDKNCKEDDKECFAK